MAHSNSSAFPAGTLVWVEASKVDLSQEEVGIVVSPSLLDYEDPETGETNRDGLLVKLKISNTRGVFPTRRLRRFETEKDTGLVDAIDVDRVSASTTSTPPKSVVSRRSQRRSTRTVYRGVVTPSPVPCEEVTSTKGIPKGPASPPPSKSPSTHSIGTQISKEFEGIFYSGKVTAYNAKSKYFKVKYEDGDEEEMLESDIKRYAVASESDKKKKTTRGSTKDSRKRKPAASKDTKLKKVPAASAASVKTKPTPKSATASKKAKRTASSSVPNTTTGAVVNGKKDVEEKAVESNDGSPLINLKKSSAKKAKSVKKSSKKTKTNAKAAEELLILASLSDSDDEKDRPFRVEYASTGRATCKGCDEKIAKNSLRIASRPLFRGKPGFVVYRHLKCQTLPEEIEQISDVGG